MDLDQLKGFYFAAKLRSFTDAAEKLYRTQPAISLQVKALEHEVGEKLFERVGRSIRLTHAGQTLYHHAEDVIAKIDEIHQVIGELRCLETGKLRIGASDTTSMYFLPRLLALFRARYPKVDLTIRSRFSQEVSREVLDREVDLGLVTLPATDRRLEVVPLFSQQLICLVHEEDPLANRRSVSAKDLARQRLVLLGKESTIRSRLEEYLGHAGRRPNVVLELSNFEIIKQYVSCGFGTGVVLEKCAESAPPSLRVIRLTHPLRIEIGAVYRRDRTPSRSAKIFLDLAVEHFHVSPVSPPGRTGRVASPPAPPSRHPPERTGPNTPTRLQN